MQLRSEACSDKLSQLQRKPWRIWVVSLCQHGTRNDDSSCQNDDLEYQIEIET